jgi:cobalt-zinc-cadmium efflux system membrane fusion protein
MNMTNRMLPALVLASALLSACSHEHDDHSHDEAGEHAESHGDRAAPAAEPDDHGHAHGGGIAVTHFSEATELFVEYPPLVSGEESAFAAHLTWLGERFTAVNEGKLVVTLVNDNGTEARAESAVSPTPGIFRPVLTPGPAGKAHLRLTLTVADRSHEHDLGEVRVYPSQEAAAATLPAEDENPAAISFTKEQQWKLDFAHEPAVIRDLRHSIAATAVIRPAANREAFVVSPIAGVLDASQADFPHLGLAVDKGQILMTVTPRLATGVDVATLESDVQRARLKVAHTAEVRQRLQQLVQVEAIAAARAVHAEHQERLARAELRAAETRIGMASNLGGGVSLRSPVAGTVVDVRTTRGAPVRDGQVLLHVADLTRVWLEAAIPESDLGRMASPTGASFRLDGSTQATMLDLGRNATLVSFGGMVNADTRTVPAIFEFDNPEGALRAGMRVQAQVYAGQPARRVAVPAAAVIDDGGQSVVFTMLDGEAFARRVVRTGIRDGDWIVIESGIEEGERVVTLGAYQVRLAATAPAAMGHGHAH